MSFWVYILECADKSYYVGHTDDLARRMSQHHTGALRGYTSGRRPVRLVYSQSFSSREQAFAAERQLKGWGRAKKEALMQRDWQLLQVLARGRNR